MRKTEYNQPQGRITSMTVTQDQKMYIKCFIVNGPKHTHVLSVPGGSKCVTDRSR